MVDLSIVPMNESNIIEVQHISKLSFPIAWSLDSLKKELDNKYANYIVLKLGDKVVGFGGMWIIFDEAHITNIAVHPDYRGHGLGDILVENLLIIARQKKLIGITLEVRKSNIAAISLYEKHGFITEGIRKQYYEDNKEDAYVMWNRKI
ncbi:ribosomal protein S18-alanine N-acetyltransferase [Clostridium sp. UBA4548]|uniref:ribosomal protein S18-alanine N-acetyltransferase n=1 Tax=Clostridium sp. UBA4548 TaxID=1946361 RepID=UPI0025C0535E|nr:ribosomal protein S18-alanine N-acetyltransferase [Clostridium sp. UBA4548]